MKSGRQSGVHSTEKSLSDCQRYQQKRVVSSHPAPSLAFSLLEVMIAMAIFFMAVFSILALVSNGLRNASALLEMPIDAGMLAAELAETNRLEEGFDSGDFGTVFPNYKWVRQITEVGTNGLYQVDFAVVHEVRGRPVETRMSILLYRPGTARPGGLRR